MRVRARITVLVLLLIALGALAAPAWAVPFYKFPIVLVPYDQVQPAIGGDTLAWNDEHGLNGYDFRMGRFLPIATGLQSSFTPQISGTRLMWSGPGFTPYWWRWFWQNNYIYDFGTGREYPVSCLIDFQSPSFAGNTVVGMTMRPTMDVYGADLTSGRIFNVCSAPKYQGWPVTDGRTVVWMDFRNDPNARVQGDLPGAKANLYGFDLTTRQEFPICTVDSKVPDYYPYEYSGPNFMHPDVAGDYVVWMDYRKASSTANNVYGFRISAGTETQMNKVSGLNIFPQVSGRTAVWQNPASRTATSDIYGYDMISGGEYPLAVSTTWKRDPGVSGRTVVWQDDSNIRGWFPHDSDMWGAMIDYRFVPPQTNPNPNAFQPYIAYITTHPTNPALGEPYTLVVVVRNHGGWAGTATVSVQESRVSQAGDPARPTRFTDSRPLAAYGDVTFEFRDFQHRWDFVSTSYLEMMRQAGTLVPPDKFRRYAEVTFANDRDNVMADILHKLGPLVQQEAQYRYDVLLEPASQLQYHPVKITAPRYQRAGLVQAIAAHLEASLLGYAGWAAPEEPAFSADQAIWQWLSRSFYGVAYWGEEYWPPFELDGEPPAYDELAALPDTPAKRAALSSLRYSGPAEGLAEVLRVMPDSDAWGWLTQTSSEAGLARLYAERAQAEVCMVERMHGLGAFPTATASKLAAFRSSLLSDGLPEISASFLRTMGWTDEELTTLAHNMAELPDTSFSIPRVSVDAPIVVEGTVRTAVEEANRIAYDVMPYDSSADTWIVLVGIPTRDGKYIGDMQVRLNYPPERGSGAPREYSVDGGYHWQPYTGPVTIPGNGTVQFASHATTGTTTTGGIDNGTRREVMKRDPIFSDVQPEFWASRQIEAAYFSGVVGGYPDGRFLPSLEVTRDQAAVYLARMSTGGEGFVPTGPAVASFPDVPSTHWAYDAIEYVKKMGIVKGYSDGLYHPERTVNRADMAIFTARTLAGSDAAVPDPPAYQSFPDVPTTMAARKYVEYLWGKGVVIGYPDGKYHPEYVLKRDQLSVFVQRAFGLPLQGG